MKTLLSLFLLLPSLLFGQGGRIGNSGSISLPLVYDVSYATTSTQLAADIAASQRGWLVVMSPLVTATSQIPIVSKNNFFLQTQVGTEIRLNTDTNDGSKGSILTIQGTSNRLRIAGFKLNCTLPSTSTNGAGYGLLTMMPGTTVNWLEVDHMEFTSPTYKQNGIGFVMFSALADGGNGQGAMLNYGLFHDSWFHDLGRMGLEIINQENKDTSTPQSRYNNLEIFNNLFQRTGVFFWDEGQAISLDGRGTGCYVYKNFIWDAVKYALEAVGTYDFHFLNNNINYSAGYNKIFTAYNIGAGGRAKSYSGAVGGTISGGIVHCTERMVNLSGVSYLDITGLTGWGLKGNVFGSADHCHVTGGSWMVTDAGERALLFKDGSVQNDFSNVYMASLTTTGLGAKCILQFNVDGVDKDNTFRNMRFYQQPNSSDNTFLEDYAYGLLTAQAFSDNLNNHPK